MALRRTLRDVGYAVLPGFACPKEVSALRQRAVDIAADFDLALLPGLAADNAELSAVCQNGAVGAATPAEYMAKSARSIRCFFEAGAFDARSGRMLVPKGAAVSKIGHALHDCDEVFRSFTRAAKVSDVFQSLGYKVPTPVQSMVMFKQAGYNSEVAGHQDSTYIFTEPLSTLGFWVALEDADEQAGCLQVVPASHRDGVSYRMVLKEGGPTTDFVGEAREPPLEDYVALPVRAGDAVVFDGALWHRSDPNRRGPTRMAYTFHAVEGTTSYSPANWLQPGLQPFRPLCGTPPGDG